MERLRVNYVAYVDPFRRAGGGEIVLRALLEAGQWLGAEIRRTCVYPSPVREAFESPDFTILADVHNMRHRWWRRRLPRRLLERIVAERRYVHVDNAYVDVCDLDYLPCNGDVEGEQCPCKSDRRFGRRLCFRGRTREMYRNAALNLFLSPLHRRTVQRLLGEEVVGRCFEMRPIIDTSRFRNEGRDRDIEYLHVGYICEAKGIKNLVSGFPEGNIVLAGKLVDRRYRRFGQQLGVVAYQEMPALMNRARVFVHLPRWPEPQGRTVAEAALCGCRLLTNENVGATTFGLDLSDPASYAGAAEEAWAAICEAVLSGSV